MDRRSVLIVTAAAPIAALVNPGRAIAAPGDGEPGDTAPPPPPPLNVTFEPLEGSDAVYAPLAPGTSQGDDTAKLVLRLRIHNTGSSSLTISGISFAFPGTSIPATYMQGVGKVMGDNGLLLAGQAKYWSNGSVTLDDNTKVKNQLYLATPVPATVRVKVSAAGYQTPTQFDATLAPYQIAHPFPFDVADLRSSECLSTRGDHWANGGAPGPQIYAHDVGVVGWDNASQKWTSLLPGTGGTKNEHFRAWDKPIRAVADGTVISISDGMDDNTEIGVFPDPTPNPVGGNYVWLSHADGTRTYHTHMRKNSITVQPGDSVVSGQILGRLGNSGNSTAPHIHLEVRRYISSNPLRPWLLTDTWMIERDAGTPWDPNSNLWPPADNRGIPNLSMLVWPSSDRPKQFVFEIPEFIEIEWPPYKWDWLAEQITGCGFEPAQLGIVDGQAFVHLRHAGRAPTRSLAELTPDEYAAQSELLARGGYRPISVAAYGRNELRYAAIWLQDKTAEWTAHHGITLDQHLERHEELTRNGFIPELISVGWLDEAPRIAASYLRAVADVSAYPLLDREELDAAIAAQARAGRQLAYVSAGQPDAGTAQFSAIFRSDAPHVELADLDRAGIVNEVHRRGKSGRRLQTLAGYVREGEPRFVAAWK